MGRISKFICPSCRTSWQVSLGHGMEHAVLENVLNAFPADIQQKILSNVKEEQIPSFDFGYQTAICRDCRDVISIPVIYLHQSGKTYFTDCPECKSPAVVYPENEELVCPRCGKGVLLSEEIGRWD